MIISDLRECLRWNITPDNQQEIYANQKDVFDSIVRSLSASKQIYDIWLKNIQSTSLDDQKPVDLILLLIMMKVNEDKAYYIEQLIRKKIRTGQFSITILDEIVEHFLSILKEYLTLFVSTLDKLFRDKNDEVVAFATHGFRTLFDVEQFNKKVLLSKLVEYVCQNQIGSETATNALRILSEFNDKNPVQMQNYALQLMRMLDRASELNLAQYRMIMNILCSIAYPLPPMVGSLDLQNHIDMLLKKQVASSIPTIKNLGIVGVVQTIEHLVWTTDDDSSQSQGNELFQTIDDIDDAAAKTAAQYLDLILSATRTSPESLGLCFDELAAVLSHRNKNQRKQLVVNKSFKIWISDFIVENFQDLFVVDDIPELDIECEYQYSINNASDNNTHSEDIEHIGVNIAGLLFKPSSNPLGSIFLLPSFFNLLRITQHYRYGNLITINALLGCAIVLPKCMNSSSEMDIFMDYEEGRAKKILDLHYLTVNWMRETISAFVSQSGEPMLKKTMTRLNEVITLEAKIRYFLELAPSNYTPPICQFNCSPNKKASTLQKKPSTAQPKTSKKARTAPNVNVESQNVTLFDILNTERTETNAPSRFSGKMNFNALNYGPKEIYRQMDPDIACLLSQELLIKYPLPSGSVGEVLGLVEFKFIMDDLVIKMESIFGVKQFVPDQPMQYVLSPSDLFNDLIKFLPQIVTFFNQLADHLYECVSGAESDVDPELYTDELNYIKVCIGLCLRLFAAFFTWSNFQLDTHKSLLKESLSKLAQSNESEVDGTISQLAQQAIENILRHASTICDLQSAVHMLHLVRSLAVFSTQPKSDEAVVNLCRRYLSRKWYGYNGALERGGKCNILLDDLLKGLMKSATFARINELLKITVRDVKELCGKNDRMKSFPNFHKANLALLYRSLCVALIEAVNSKLNKSAPTSVQLRVFEKSTALLQILADIVGFVNIPRNYAIFLKQAHIYFKIFLQHGIPLIKTGLRSNSDKILEFLQGFNHIASFLHKICCHWKANQNNTIMAQIPFVRETIETLLIKVKAVLAANNCAAAFWQNNLKNKNLHGEEILTQSTETTDDNDDEDEELPEDDDSLEDECLEYDQDGSRETSVETTRRISKVNSDASSLLC
ncbi:hypothetical protein HA402_000191 [Bradysia odoriphaga]|nr:hypothetical protein HA402_000191 [Bradysia odoriphaga]